ncbi:thioredoxin family protein [Saccharicrinis sp. FJH2]|uniref:thioredoxin family protein n=1 Tax=Saccharicrinis sp. FJH65 TaxID=3344659 RepID=UPI0035F4EF94
MPINIKNELREHPAVFLYFKNETCQPCKVLRVKVQELLEAKYENIRFHVLDIADYPEYVAEFNVLSSPTMLLFLDGKEFFRGGIYTSISELDEKLNRFYSLMF